MSATYSVVWSAVLSSVSTTVAVGSCLVADGSGKYVISTTANRGTSKTTGVARSAGGPGDAVQIQTYGPIPATVTGLGAGTASKVIVNASGALERKASPVTSDEVVGWAETDGSMFCAFGIDELLGGGSGGDSISGYYDMKTDGGASGDGSTDDTAALTTALAAVASDGRALWFPPGQYRFASSVTITQRVCMLGIPGNNVDDSGDMATQSVLLFDQGYGLVLGTGAMGSHIQDLGVEQGATTEAGTTDGITINERTSFQNVTVRYFGGDGFYVPASAGSLGTECHFVNCSTLNCDKGIHLLAGNQTVLGGKHTSSRGEAIYASNTFGSFFAGVKLRSCNSGGTAFHLSGAFDDFDGQGQNVAVGCSVSGGNGDIRIHRSSTWIGGNTGGGFNSNTNGQVFANGDYFSPLTVTNTKGTLTITSSLGADSTNMVAFQWESSDDANEYRFAYDDTTNVERFFVKQMGESFNAYELTHLNNSQGAGYMQFPVAFILGNSSNGRFQLQSTAKPTGTTSRTSSNYWQGDFSWNRNPSLNGTLGWVCIGDGQPGTWIDIPIDHLSSNQKARTDREHHQYQTTNNTQATACSFTTATDNVYQVIADVVAIQSDGSTTAEYTRRARAKNDGGTLTMGTVTDVHTDEEAGFSTCDVTLDVSGTDIRVRVTGVAATTIEWGIKLQILAGGV